MLKKVLLAILAALAILMIVIATRPSTSHFERSTVVAAPADIVFAKVNDFHHWQLWSPWEQLDLTMVKKFSGPDAGKGAVYEWNSPQDNVGSGRMTIENANPPKDVDIKLEFIEPFAATNKVRFVLTPEGEGTKVLWTMDGENNFGMKAYGLFADMDAMIGKDFEQGLRALKALSEAEKKKADEAAKKAEEEAAASKKAAEDAAAAALAEAEAAAPKKKK